VLRDGFDSCHCWGTGNWAAGCGCCGCCGCRMGACMAGATGERRTVDGWMWLICRAAQPPHGRKLQAEQAQSLEASVSCSPLGRRAPIGTTSMQCRRSCRPAGHAMQRSARRHACMLLHRLMRLPSARSAGLSVAAAGRACRCGGCVAFPFALPWFTRSEHEQRPGRRGPAAPGPAAL
jgi:hypothetical protein